MSIDKDKLKALALAATPGQWVTEGEYVNEHGHLLYAYVAHENSGMIAEAFANCRVKTDDECRGNAAFIAGANPANILALLSEFDALHDRAAYWRQRAKSAEGHLYSADFQTACDELHKVSNYADIPPEQLSDVQKARISSAVHTVLRAVNARRDLRRPTDVTGRPDNQNLTHQASDHSVD